MWLSVTNRYFEVACFGLTLPWGNICLLYYLIFLFICKFLSPHDILIYTHTPSNIRFEVQTRNMFQNTLHVFSVTLISATCCVRGRKPAFFMYLCVSGALVVFLETSCFLKDQFLQLLLGKVVQFHGESEGLLCYRLHAHTNTHFEKSNFIKIQL